MIAVEVLIKLVNSSEIKEYDIAHCFWLLTDRELSIILAYSAYNFLCKFSFPTVQIFYSSCKYGDESSFHGSCK